MTINDPETTRTAHVIHTTEVRESNAAGWWIGALVAIVAILAVVFLVYSSQTPATSQADLTNAVEQGRMQGALESAQSNLAAAQDQARAAADQAAAATQEAREATTAAAASAADASAAAAETMTEPIVVQ